MTWYPELPNVPKCSADDADFACRLPEKLASNADIAGRGVVIAFSVAAVLAIIAGGFGLASEAVEYKQGPGKHHHARRWREKVDVFLVSLGDTQILTSIALLMIVNFAVGCKITAYHYNLVCNLVLISSAAHIGSMAFVHKYFSRSWLLAGIRGSLLLLTFAFGWVLFHGRFQSEIFPISGLGSSSRNANGTIETGLVLPASCFIAHPGLLGNTSVANFTASQYWNMNIKGTVAVNSSAAFGVANDTNAYTYGRVMANFHQFNNNDGLSKGFENYWEWIAVTVALAFAILASVILCKSRDPGDYTRIHWFAWILRCISYLLVLIVMVRGIVQFKRLQDWMKDSKWFGDDEGESEWRTFGQLMPLILLILPALALLEEICGNGKPRKHQNHRRMNGDDDMSMEERLRRDGP